MAKNGVSQLPCPSAILIHLRHLNISLDSKNGQRMPQSGDMEFKET